MEGEARESEGRWGISVLDRRPTLQDPYRSWWMVYGDARLGSQTHSSIMWLWVNVLYLS